MAKRVIALFAAFALVMGGLFLRVYQINIGDFARTATSNHSKIVPVSSSRGMIYDCNLQRLVGDTQEYIAAVRPSEEALRVLKTLVDDTAFAAALETLQSGSPAAVRVGEASCDSSDITILPVFRRYAPGQLAAHVIGYLDGEGAGVSGVEKSCNELLAGASGTLSVAFGVDARGRLLTGAAPEVRDDNYNTAQGVCLTIDKRVQQAVEESLHEAGFTRGAAVVLDVQTGKIRAMASTPSFQAESLAESLNDPDSPLINRALSAYAVGSIFKVVVVAAALEQGIPPSFSYECTGQVQVGDVVFNCHEHSGHGVITMREAVAHSCNTYFIHLAEQIGPGPILEMAERMGLGTAVELAPGLFSDQGNLPEEESLDVPAALANLAFGQGTLLATPLQMAGVFLAAATGGEYRSPSLVEGTVGENGVLTPLERTAPPIRVVSRTNAQVIDDFLLETVRTGSGVSAKPKTCSAAGKTATAQSGWYVDGVEVNHSWFAGFFPAESPRYVVVVMKEDGIAGGTDCAPVFQAVADRICQYVGGI